MIALFREHRIFRQIRPMKMKKAILLVFGAVVAVFVFKFFLIDDSERKNAARIISGIEEYRRQEGRLPDPDNHPLMQSLGFELGGVGWDPDYRSLGATNYCITIWNGFDGPHQFYESKSEEWIEGYPSAP